jgi:hypothetical protein
LLKSKRAALLDPEVTQPCGHKATFFSKS